MKRLRTVSTRRLLAIVGAVALLALTAGIAQGALSGGNPTPDPKPLDRAVVGHPQPALGAGQQRRGRALGQRARRNEVVVERD